MIHPSASNPGETAIMSGVMGGVNGEAIFYYDIAIDIVEVDKVKVSRGEVVKFKITLANRGERDWTIIDMRMISRGVVLVEEPVKIEVPYYYEANGSDNWHRVHPDIVIH